MELAEKCFIYSGMMSFLSVLEFFHLGFACDIFFEIVRKVKLFMNFLFGLVNILWNIRKRKFQLLIRVLFTFSGIRVVEVETVMVMGLGVEGFESVALLGWWT